MADDDADVSQQEENRRPRPGDSPFALGANRFARADLDFLHVAYDDCMVAEGFRDAADRIVDSVEAQNSPPYPDRLLHPVAFLYRHYLELELKGLLHSGVQLGVVDQTGKLSRAMGDHDLRALWIRTKRFLGEVFPDEDPTPLNAVEEVILAFHDLDPRGQSFRYHTDKNGRRQLENAPKTVDLTQMRDVMKRVAGFFDDCDAAIGHMIDCQSNCEL